MKVSVWMSAYNHEKYISQCLDSVLNQKTDFDFEVLIHDDASTDTTAEIIKEYKLGIGPKEIIEEFMKRKLLPQNFYNLNPVL